MLQSLDIDIQMDWTAREGYDCAINNHTHVQKYFQCTFNALTKATLAEYYS